MKQIFFNPGYKTNVHVDGLIYSKLVRFCVLIKTVTIVSEKRNITFLMPIKTVTLVSEKRNITFLMPIKTVTVVSEKRNITFLMPFCLDFVVRLCRGSQVSFQLIETWQERCFIFERDKFSHRFVIQSLVLQGGSRQGGEGRR